MPCQARNETVHIVQPTHEIEYKIFQVTCLSELRYLLHVDGICLTIFTVKPI